MSNKEWKKHMLKKEYHELKQAQMLRKSVRSALACRREETGGIMDELRADLEELEAVFHQLMGHNERDDGETEAGNLDREEPLSQLWQIVQHLEELHDRLKEMTDEEEQLVRELNMEQEQVAEEIERVSMNIAQFGCQDRSVEQGAEE
jgi:chromosome segregation ATPase